LPQEAEDFFREKCPTRWWRLRCRIKIRVEIQIGFHGSLAKIRYGTTVIV
jgi:hypothetical protein